jgi:hypothetical protein
MSRSQKRLELFEIPPASIGTVSFKATCLPKQSQMVTILDGRN